MNAVTRIAKLCVNIVAWNQAKLDSLIQCIIRATAPDAELVSHLIPVKAVKATMGSNIISVGLKKRQGVKSWRVEAVEVSFCAAMVWKQSLCSLALANFVEGPDEPLDVAMIVFEGFADLAFDSESKAQSMLLEVDHVGAVEVVVLSEGRDVWVGPRL